MLCNRTAVLSLIVAWSLGTQLGLAFEPPKRVIRDTCADVATLKDGSVVLGEFAGYAPSGGLKMIVSREWAEANQADAFKRWQKVDQGLESRRAIAQRIDRLKQWKVDRASTNKGLGSDELTTWIDEECIRLQKPEAITSSRLLTVRLSGMTSSRSIGHLRESRNISTRPGFLIFMIRKN